MTQNKIIGITGGVGAGKSTVLGYIDREYDVCIIYADEVGRELMDPGKSVYNALKEYYGEIILKKDGSIDRQMLAKIGLKDEKSAEILNSIEHPLIREEIVFRIERSGKPVIFLEAALLKEGGLAEICEEIWAVTADLQTRIKRLYENRGYSSEKSRMIIERQLSEAEFEEISDILIENSGDFSLTEKQIDAEMSRLGAVRKNNGAETDEI